MRMFSLFMAVLIQVLSCLPCADGDDLPGTYTQAQVTAAHTHDHSDTDICSPFCHCACCAGSILQLSFTELQITAPECPLHHFGFYTAAITEAFLPVWQPPQSA
jgi:hypothetical protein